MKPIRLFILKICVAALSFLIYVALMAIEMYTGKPLIPDAKTLMVFSFGVFSGMVSHLLTQGAPKVNDSIIQEGTPDVKA